MVDDVSGGDTDSSSSSDDEDEDGQQGVDKTNDGSTSSSADSLTGTMPKGQKRKQALREVDEDEDDNVDRFRRGEKVSRDYEIAKQSDDEDNDDSDDASVQESDSDDEMGAQLEREFLGDDFSNSSFGQDN